MYRAGDQFAEAEVLGRIERASDRLELGSDARSYAADIYLSQVPDAERSKPAVAAASLYAGALIAGDECSQSDVADAMDVTRLSVQSRWKEALRTAGFEPPEW